MRRSLLLAGCAVLLAVFPARAVHAHKMLAASRVMDDGEVLLQCFFPDGAPARGVHVEVRRPDGSLFLEGETNREGELTFQPDDAHGQWSAVFTASAGHRTVADFTLTAPPAQVGAEEPTGANSPTTASSNRLRPRDGQAAAGTAETVELARRQPVPWTEVLAGLGFIFGTGALLMCLKLRAEMQRREGE